MNTAQRSQGYGLFSNIAQWQQKTFPKATVLSALQHLKEEADEAIEAETRRQQGEGGNKPLGEELADLQHLLIQAAERAGIDLIAATSQKFGKNLVRTWNPPDERGVVYHKAEGVTE